MTDSIQKFIVAYLEQKSKKNIPKDRIDTTDYWEEGYIDSMGIFLFMVELEEKFDVSFEEDELQAPEFRTIGGLTNLILKKLAEK